MARVRAVWSADFRGLWVRFAVVLLLGAFAYAGIAAAETVDPLPADLIIYPHYESAVGKVARARRQVAKAALVDAGSSTSGSIERQRRIYLLEGLAPGQPGGTAAFEGFRQRLTERSFTNYEIFLDYLELGRFPGTAHEERIVRFLGEKFSQNPPDLLVPNGPGSLRLLVRHRELIAPQAPIVYCCVTSSDAEQLALPRDVIGVITEYNWAETLLLAARLQPTARNLVLVSGASEVDKRWRERALSNLRPHLDQYQVRYLFDLNYDDLLNRVASLPHETIVLQIAVFADAAGRRFFPPDSAAGIAAASAAPVYSPVPVLLGRGVVGGYMDSYEGQGGAMADLALEIFAGKDPATLPSQTKLPHSFRVDANALERWGIDESALPPAAVVLFKKPTIWDQYRWQLLAILGALVVQALVISWLLIEQFRRRLAERQSRARLLEVIHLNQAATAGALSASIAHELNQPLGAIATNAEAAAAMLRGEAPDLKLIQQILTDIRNDDQRASDIIQRLRGLLQKRRKVEWQEFDLNEVVSSAIRILSTEAQRKKVEVVASQAKRELPVRADQVHIQQVILNIATNAMDAMLEAGTVHKKLLFETALSEPSNVEVRISDTGCGIPAGQRNMIFEPFYTTKASGTGLGLSIARAIVETYGGRIWVESGSEGGAAFHFMLPLAHHI